MLPKWQPKITFSPSYSTVSTSTLEISVVHFCSPVESSHICTALLSPQLSTIPMFSAISTSLTLPKATPCHSMFPFSTFQHETIPLALPVMHLVPFKSTVVTEDPQSCFHTTLSSKLNLHTTSPPTFPSAKSSISSSPDMHWNISSGVGFSTVDLNIIEPSRVFKQITSPLFVHKTRAWPTSSMHVGRSIVTENFHRGSPSVNQRASTLPTSRQTNVRRSVATSATGLLLSSKDQYLFPVLLACATNNPFSSP
mmetsp:Transcript_26238/g.49610  ORF Transcript_26238/g.49610 Transcript_26238/m.49610 type:complete len:253 (-) Transcript_26238:58-816(-)